MKTWKLLLAVTLAAVAVLLMTSMVVAAPAPASGAQLARVYGDQVLTGTVPMTHPVANKIALYFNIPYTQVMALYAEGFGFGEIARAYLTALASGGTLTPTQLLEMHQAGVGWGQIKKEYGVHPGGNGLGTIMREKPVAPPEPTTPAPPEVKPGNNVPSCPGNSCNAPGQNKFGKGPKPETPNGPKNK